MVRFAAAAIALVTSLVGLAASGSQITLLEFSTTSCTYCRQMEPLIQSFEQAGYPIRKIDASVEPQAAQKYNVTRFPTFVMLVDGREISRNVGAMDGNQLTQMFQQAKAVAGQGQQSAQLAQSSQQPPRSDREPAEPSQPVDPAHASLLSATVRLRVDEGKYRSFGTGTIIDSRQGEALIITCAHLFRDSKGKAPVNVELFEAVDGHVRVAGETSGWVLSYDLEREVALVVIRTGRAVTPAPIAPLGVHVARGDRVVCIGCSNGDDPTVLPTRITALDRYQGAPNVEAAGAPVEGRSGGGLFNDKGQLVGVCYAADYEGNEGLYAALDSIHDEVARLNLFPNKDKNDWGPTGDSSQLADSRESLSRTEPIFRGQDNPPLNMPAPSRGPITPVAAVTTVGPAGLPNEKPAGLNPAEQAAWEEIVKRSSQSEVIIIVRPKEPGGESEVITLNNVSPEFVRAVAGRQRGPQAPQTR